MALNKKKTDQISFQQFNSNYENQIRYISIDVEKSWLRVHFVKVPISCCTLRDAFE